MDRFIDFLQTPLGSDLVHAVILLVVAAAAWIQFKTHQVASDAKTAIEDHVEAHMSERSTPTNTPKDP
jgi:hypothetical protein